MAINIPMNTLKKVIYKGVELNAFNVAGCKWRKPYNITIPTNVTGIAQITVTRSASESNCGQLNTTYMSGSGTVLYGDTLSVEATAATGYNNPTASFTEGVSNNKVTGDVTVTATAGSLKTYPITISNSSYGTVKNGSTVINSGDRVAHGTVLTITPKETTARYSYSVSSSTGTISNNTLTVDGAETITFSRATRSYTITISNPSYGTVKIGSTTITSGTKVDYGTILTLTPTAATGYITTVSSSTGTISNNQLTVDGAETITFSRTAGYYTVSLDAITNASAYVNTSASGYSGSITAQYGSTIYVQVKPNNCYVYTLNNTNYTPSSPYTTSYVLNSTNFNLSSTTPAASPTESNIPTATKSIGGNVTAAYYKVTLSVTNGTVTSGATTTIQYGNSISYTAKGNSKYYYVNKTTGGYGDSGYSTTYTPTSSVLPADGGATSATAVAVSHTVGSCTAYKTYTIRSANASGCNMYTYVKSAHALGETSFTSKSNSGSQYTVYETDVFYSYGYATNMGGYKMTEYSCTNNGVTVSPTSYNYLTVSGSGSNTSWTTTTSSTASTGILYRVYFGTSTSPKTINGNVGIAYAGAALQYTYYGYNSNIYSSKINSGTTYVNIYDRNKVSKEIPRLAYYPASAIRINGCICLQKDGTNSEFSNQPLTSKKTANLKYGGISGTASMGNQGPASGNSGAAQRQWLSVSHKPGAYKFYVRIWGLSIPS